jgi:hypothetical protein
MLAGKQKAIHEERDRNLKDAREDRAKIRVQQAAARNAKSTRPEDSAMLGSTPPGRLITAPGSSISIIIIISSR